MLKHTHTAVLFVFCLLYGDALVLAQSSPALIPFMAYEIGAPYSIEREPGVINRGDFQTDGFGVSINHTASLGIMLNVPDLLQSNFGLIFRANVVQSDGRFTSNPYTGTRQAVSSLNGLRLTTQNQFVVRGTESQGQMGLMGTWSPWRSALLGIGPWIGYRFSSNVTQTEEILSPSEAIFLEEENRKRTVAAGDEITSFNWRFGGGVELMQRIPLSSMVHLAPFVGTRFDAEALFNKGMGLRAFSLLAGLGFAVDIFSEESAPVADTGTTLTASSLPTFALSAQIDLYDAGNQDKADTLRIGTEQIVYTRYLPLFPLLHFPAGDTTLATNYRLIKREETEEFTRHSLFERTPAEIERASPNIIGERMRSLVPGELRLTGLYRPEESVDLALKRCHAVQRYLTEIWGIDSARIRIAGTEAHATQGGVHLSSAAPALLAPLVLQWEREEFIPPNLILKKQITAQAGVQRWEVVLRQGEEVVGRLNSDMGKEDEEEAFASLPFNDSTAHVPIEATLTVVDYTGALTTAHDRLTVAPADSAQHRQVRTWHFFDPAYDPSLRVVNNAFLQLIAESAENGSQIRVEGDERGSDSDFGKEWVARALLQQLIERRISPAAIMLEVGEKDSAEHWGRRSVVVTLQ